MDRCLRINTTPVQSSSKQPKAHFCLGGIGFRVTKPGVSRKLNPASGAKKENLTGTVENKTPVRYE